VVYNFGYPDQWQTPATYHPKKNNDSNVQKDTSRSYRREQKGGGCETNSFL